MHDTGPIRTSGWSVALQVLVSIAIAFLLIAGPQVETLWGRVRDRLVEQRERIAHRSLGPTRDQCERRLFDLDLFLCGNIFKVLNEGSSIEAPQDWQCMSSVWLMRAMVWWVPQLGH